MFKNFVVSLFYASFAFCAVEPLNVLNFAATNGANDIVTQNDTLWIATNGGLAQFQSSSENFIALHHSHQHFPDISLSALCVDGDILWIGSENGYLYRRQRRGQKIYDDLFVVKSKINVIKPYENYLIIGHEKGMSVFDAKKGKIISTKRNFDDFGAGGVSLIEIKSDTLWAVIKSGATNGVVKLEKFSSYIKEPKFGDDSPLAQQVPWQTLENSLGEVKTLIYQNGIKYFENFALFDENYRIEYENDILKDRYILIKYDNSGKKIAENDSFGNAINFLKYVNGNIAVGTKTDFSWFVDFENDKNNRCLVIPGFFNSTSIEKLFVDDEQSLWILPRLIQDGRGDDGWWVSLAKMSKNGKIDRYNEHWDGFGHLSKGCPDFTAVAQSKNKMYFGYCGDPLREYDLNTGSWSVWVLDTREYVDYPSLVPNWGGEWYGYYWLKVDALITDKNGVVWGTYWRDLKLGFGVEIPLVFAFNPQKEQFRYLLISGRDDLVFPNNFAFSGRGDLLLGFANKDELWVIDANKDPFDTKIETMNYRKDTVFAENNVTKLQTTGAGNIFVGTFGAPQIFAYDKSSSLKPQSIKNLPERFIAKTNDVVLEYCDTLFGFDGESMEIRNVFWIANANVGAQRAVISEYLSPSGVLDSAVYDTAQTIFSLNPTSGAINQEAFSLAVDSIQNFLWVGGDKGLTRIRLPQRNSASSQANTDFLFPNPLSLTMHEFISIPGASQNSLVDIYTVSGKLVAHLDENGAEWTRNIDGNSFYRWKAPKNIAPGTYIVAVKEYEGEKIARKKTKTYKLVVLP
ncbi:MAG: hypothetical protein FWF51_01150 [Chitinivibrionia bacterium]|nr:hypothetical protein [Chitinivibrionia bacterium]